MLTSTWVFQDPQLPLEELHRSFAEEKFSVWLHKTAALRAKEDFVQESLSIYPAVAFLEEYKV